jgi:chorismate lyase / 3-hydroxybenzoate synthase
MAGPGAENAAQQKMPPLGMAFVEGRLGAREDLLGAAFYGPSDVIPLSEKADTHWVARVAMPRLPAFDEIGCAWLSSGPFITGSLDGLRYRYNDQLLFGAIALREEDFAPEDGASALQLAAQTAYRTVFATLEETGFRYLARCWNYLPRINVDGGGLERYRQFNIGRQDAFIATEHSHLAGAPAACALGTHAGGLSLYFIASHTAPLTIENPRQVSAYRYPQRYGPRSPTFSRASLLKLKGREILFVSGTASIVGHESMHAGEVALQTAETLRNLDAVVEQANLQSDVKGFVTRNLSLKVFLRRPADQATVAAILRQRLGDDVDVIYLLADICREELLVEIEAVGFLDTAAQ